MSYAGTLSGKKTERRRGLLLTAASVVVSLFVLEIVTRQLLPEPLPWLYPQVKYRSDPALFFALAPNQKAVTADKPASINARGLRGPLVPYARQGSNILRVLFLGDSIVFGFGVFEAEALPSRVGQLLAERGVRTEVINSGVPGYSTNQEVVFAEQEGIKYRPDWVVLGFCWNDISDKSGDRVSQSGALMAAGEKETDHRAAALLQSSWGYDLRNLIKRSRAAYGAMQGAQTLRALWSPSITSVIVPTCSQDATPSASPKGGAASAAACIACASLASVTASARWWWHFRFRSRCRNRFRSARIPPSCASSPRWKACLSSISRPPTARPIPITNLCSSPTMRIIRTPWDTRLRRAPLPIWSTHKKVPNGCLRGRPQIDDRRPRR